MSKKRNINKNTFIPNNEKRFTLRFVPPFDIGELTLRPLATKDAQAHKKLCDAGGSKFGDFLGFATNIQNWNLEQHKQWIVTNQMAGYPFDSYGAFYGNHLLGLYSYARAGDLLGCQICYYTGSDVSGRGIATEVTNVMVEKAFTLAGFEYVELHIDAANVASQKVASNAGFEYIKEYKCEKMGKKGTGQMQLWIKLNPNGKHGISLDNFRNDDYNYLVPVYANIETFIESGIQMKLIADKIRRAQLALAGKIPLEEVHDIFEEYEKQNPEVA